MAQTEKGNTAVDIATMNAPSFDREAALALLHAAVEKAKAKPGLKE